MQIFLGTLLSSLIPTTLPAHPQLRHEQLAMHCEHVVCDKRADPYVQPARAQPPGDLAMANIVAELPMFPQQAA